MKKISWLLLLAISFACSCGPMDSTLTSTKPNNADLAGRYVPTDRTLTLIRNEGQYAETNISFALSKDGTFQMCNMPDWWKTDFGKPKGGFDSGDGKWRSERDQAAWVLRLEFSSRRNFSSDHSDAALFTSINLVGQSPPYQLRLYIGDPDDQKMMIFEKQE